MALKIRKPTRPATFTANDVEFVVLPRAEYDALVHLRNVAVHGNVTFSGNQLVGVEGVNLEDDEDAGASRIIAYTNGAIETGRDIALPEVVWERLESGANPVAVLRDWRGITQAQLADEAGISQPFLSQIEKNVRTPAVTNLIALSKALRVPVELLIPDTDVVIAEDRIG